jgi:hypothetical protein
MSFHRCFTSKEAQIFLRLSSLSAAFSDYGSKPYTVN